MINFILYRAGQLIAMLLPLKTAYRIAVLLCDLHYIFASLDRREVKENLKAIFPKKTGKEISSIRISMFRNFAKYMVDFFRFSKLDYAYIKKNIKVENIHYLDQAISRGKGVILVSAHMGNWELGAAVIALLGYPLWVVALPHKYRKVNNFFNFQRESKGVKVIPLGKAVKQSLAILKENKILALVGDIDFSGKGVILDFFGKPSVFPQGPAALSIKTGASVIPGFMLRNNDNSFTLKFEKPLQAMPETHIPAESLFLRRKSNGLIELTKEYKIIFEDYIKKHPDQWYMFRRFWKDS